MSLADLPPTHRRSVATTLRLMEERLEEVLRWLDEGGRRTATRVIVDDLDPACRAELRWRLERALGQVGRWYAQLDLPPGEQSLFRNCNGTLGLTWELPPDLRPERMVGYGTLPPELAPELAELASDLERVVLDAQATLIQRGEDPDRPR
jgi:hypothetical protein